MRMARQTAQYQRRLPLYFQPECSDTLLDGMSSTRDFAGRVQGYGALEYYGLGV